MMKPTTLIRSTLASLITGLFLAPSVHAAGIEIRENQDFSEHMVSPAEAVAPGAKIEKPVAAPQKMRITANGIVPEAADETAAASPVAADDKPAKADVAAATPSTKPEQPASEAPKGSDENAVAPASAAKPASTLAGNSVPANTAAPVKPTTIKAEPTATTKAAATATTKTSGSIKPDAKEQARVAKKDSEPTDATTLTPEADEDDTTAQVKQAAVATAPVAATPPAPAPAPAESGKAELVDGLTMRITEDGIIPESEYEIQMPSEDVSLAERDEPEPAGEDIARKARKALTGTSKSYTVSGIRYKPLSIDETSGFSQEGIASWYGPGFHGRKTANGETFNQNAMTAAHKRLPISSYVRVTRVSTGKSIVVRINDRGPFVGNRVIDLSYGAAKRLGIVNRGSDKVKIERISKEAAAGERSTETQAKAKKML